jgi:hypothetical protein
MTRDLEGELMRQQPLPPDPLTLTRIGMATWLTGLLVAQKIGEGLREQNALMTDATRGLEPVGPPR